MNAPSYRYSQYAQMVRFALAGGVASISHLAIFAYLVTQELFSPVVASGVAFMCAFLVSFTLQKFWTFSDTQVDRPAKQLVAFFLMQLGLLLFNLISIYWLVEKLAVQAIAAQALTLIVTATMSFLISKNVIFIARADSKLTEI